MWLFKRKKDTVANLYRKCNVLPVHNFNEIATNNDFDYLKVNKNDVVSNEILQEVWIDILDEYYKISKNNKALVSFKKQTDLILLHNKLAVYEAIKICVNKGIDVTIECQKYRIDKNQINAHIGILKNDISRITKSIPTDEVKKSESEFDRTIAVLSQAGFKIDRFTTVVSEWVQMLSIFEQQNKPQN